jgi:hypothetical protein
VQKKLERLTQKLAALGLLVLHPSVSTPDAIRNNLLAQG